MSHSHIPSRQMKQIFAGSTFIEVATAEEVLLHVAKQDFDLLLIDEEMPLLLEDSSKDAMLGDGWELNPGCMAMVSCRAVVAACTISICMYMWFVHFHVLVHWFLHTAATGSQAISEIRRRESVEHNKNSNMNHNRSRRLRIVSCTSRSSEPVVSSRIMAAGADLLWGKPFPGRTEMYNTLSKLFA